MDEVKDSVDGSTSEAAMDELKDFVAKADGSTTETIVMDEVTAAVNRVMADLRRYVRMEVDSSGTRFFVFALNHNTTTFTCRCIITRFTPAHRLCLKMK